MKLLSLVMVVLGLSSMARAGGRLDVHAGGGMDGGMLPAGDRPDGVGELGVGVAWFPRHGVVGVGLTLDTVKREHERFPIGTEHRLDATVRMTNARHRFHAGVGLGLRSLTLEAGEDRPASHLYGFDAIRMDFDLQITGANLDGARLGVDLYFSWTFGCYLGDVIGTRMGDMAYPKRHVGCTETMTTSYILGLQTSFAWR